MANLNSCDDSLNNAVINASWQVLLCGPAGLAIINVQPSNLLWQ